jgi:lipopolysaccharide export system permease protein
VIISRYIRREIFSTLLAITLILVLAFLSQQLVRYLNYVAIGKIPTSVLLELVSFEAPYLLALLLPLGLYLGIMLTYGRLYSDNEMAILQMSGYSDKRLMRLAALMAGIVASVVLVLMLWVNPEVSAKRQQLMASDETTVHLIQTLIPGRFQVSPDGHHVMYVEKLSRNRQRAQNIFLAQEKKNPQDALKNSWMLVLASEGYQSKDKESQDQFFVTTDGYRYEGSPGQNDYKIIQFGKYEVRIPKTDVHVTHEENESLSTWQLWRDYGNKRRAAEFQWRFSIAISAIILAMLAVPLSTIQPRQGRYLALLPAVLVYIVYINLLFMARHWVEYGFVPIAIGMWWVHVVALFFVLFIMMYFSKKR